MRLIAPFVLWACMFFFSCANTREKVQYEKRILIAVGDFQNRTNDTLYDELMYTSTGNLIYELSQSGVFRIIERERIGSLLDEYQLARTGILTSANRQELGDILGVDAILVVTLSSVQYHVSEQNFSTKNIAHKIGSRIPANLVAFTASEALDVNVDARLISVGNGEVLAAAKYKGSSENFYSAIIGITSNGNPMDKRQTVKKILSDSTHILARDISNQTRENFQRVEN